MVLEGRGERLGGAPRRRSQARSSRRQLSARQTSVRLRGQARRPVHDSRAEGIIRGNRADDERDRDKERGTVRQDGTEQSRAWKCR